MSAEAAAAAAEVAPGARFGPEDDQFPGNTRGALKTGIFWWPFEDVYCVFLGFVVGNLGDFVILCIIC